MKLFLLKSFKGGLSDWENVGIEGAFKFGSNLDIHRNIDSLTSKQALVDDLAIGTMTALAKFIVSATDGNTYFFCSDGKIFKRTSAGVYSLVHTDADGAIIGACEWSQNNSKSYLFWATSTKLHSKEIPGVTNWSDVDATILGQTYPKTNLTASTWHTMKIINGVMLICNSDTLAMVAFDGSYTYNALQLIPGNKGKCLMENKGYACIGNTKTDLTNSAELFVWDTSQSLSWNAKNTVPTNAINALINAEYPIMQVGTNGQLVLADIYSYAIPITSFPGGGQVNPDAVDIDEGLALFGSYGNGTGKSGVYSYGRKKKNANLSLNLEYALDCTEIGSIRKSGSDLFISYSTTLGYGVKKVSSTTKAIGTYESLDLKFPVGEKEPILNMIRLVTAPLPTGTSIECYRKMDKSSTFVQCNLEGGDTSFDIVGGQEAYFLVGDKGKVAEIKLVLNPSGNYAPEIYQAELHFD